MISIPITAFYASILGIFLVFLSILVIVQRRSAKVSLGDGGDRHMLQMTRAHANFTEYVPLILVLLMIAEINQVNPLFLHVIGWVLVISRFLHAYGLRHHFGPSWQRGAGILLTFACLLVLSGVNLWPLFFKSQS